MSRCVRLWAVVFVALMLAAPAVSAQATSVPGHKKARYDTDGNGYPDIGVVVSGKYTSVYAVDASGNWYWDLGDGRVDGTVASIDALDQTTLDVCDYQNHYRGSFNNDSFMDSGWIINNIHCYGYSGNSAYTYQIVHASDPRYSGNPEWAIWGDWEYHVLTESGSGNLVTRPESHVRG